MIVLCVRVYTACLIHSPSIEGYGANGDVPLVVRAGYLHPSPYQGSNGACMADEIETAPRGRAKRTTFVDEETWTKFGEFKAAITGRKGENSVRQLLSAPGVSALHDVLLPDPVGVTQLDHLVRALDSILVIETKAYGGYVTGTPDSAEWLQHLAAGEQRYVFQNPLRQNRRHCLAVEATLAGLDVPVAGVIVSAGSATFCDALQRSVVPLARLGEVFRPATQRCQLRQLDIAWQRLIRVAAAAESRREEHVDSVRQRRGLRA
jgi:Nuclease-related domain